MWKMMHVKMFGWVLRKFTKHFRTEEHQNYTSSLAQFICEEGSSGPHWLSCFLCCMNLLQGHFAGFHRSLVGSPMISLMMQHLLPLATLLLLSIVPTETKVVASVAQCNESFLAQTPPNIPGILVGGNINDHNRYKVICQTLRDIRRFVTLYDTKNRIPVFSAAEYRGGPAGKRPKIKWMIEPQLENTTDNPNMRPSNDSIDYENQAGNKDYKNTGFSRGHLFPNSYGSTDLKKNSTFTLTNIVPQIIKFNSGSWNKMEECIKCVLNKYCINNNGNIEGFVVIGAQPSNNSLNNRINIPSVLWSAFCCYSHSKNSWLSSAHWGNNTDHKPEHLKTRTLGKLHRELKIEVFPKTKCPKNTTVTHLYSNLPSNCSCPKTSSKSAPTTSTATTSVSASSSSTSNSPIPPSTTSFSSPGTSAPLSPTVPNYSTTSGKPTTGPLGTTTSVYCCNCLDF
uniref:Uncharacterized LOC112843133 n=1 Tax=Oreochromis niloticus TaxID=8128 RepID=I3JTL0_ORENI